MPQTSKKAPNCDDEPADSEKEYNNKAEQDALFEASVSDCAQQLTVHVQNRLSMLENTIFENAALIAKLLEYQQQPQPKWHHLLHLQSTNILIHDRRSMELLGMNTCSATFLQKFGNLQYGDTQKPNKLLPVLPPLLLLLHLNVMHSKCAKNVIQQHRNKWYKYFE